MMILHNINKAVIGITGSLGSGKTTIANALQKHLPNFHIIEIDDVRRYILWQSVEKEHIFLRKQLSVAFNLPTTGEQHWLDRNVFTRILFSSQDKLQLYSALATPVIKSHIESVITQYSYCILVWAYMIEEGYVNYNDLTILVKTPPHIVLKRFFEQIKNSFDTNIEDISKRISFEPSYESRLNYLHQHTSIEYSNTENIIELENILITINNIVEKKQSMAA